MSSDQTQIFTRVDDELLRRFRKEAEIRYTGNQSMTLRAAVVLYLDLREKLGPQFDAVIFSMLASRSQNAA